MFGSFVKRLISGDPLKKYEERVSDINALEAEFGALTDDGLLGKSKELKQKVQDGASLDDALIPAFALVREASKRTLGKRPYDVQLVGGMVLHSGAVAEMATGEGKTLAAVAPAYLNALVGRGAHVVTVNEYLARRDAVWMGQIYYALGLSVACLVPNGAFIYDPKWHIAESGEKLIDDERDETGSFLVQQEYLRPVQRREAYLADVVYGTNHEFGFDYLRDNLAYQLEGRVQREHYFAIVDEVDSILIDEARTPLIISAPDTASSEYYKTFARIADKLVKDEDYTVDEKFRSVSITEGGIGKVENFIGVKNLYAPENIRLVHYLEESLKAVALFKRDKDYVVKNGEIFIVDEFTGRILHGRRYNGGLHQAIEAKEGVFVKEESRTYAKISIQNYFRLYSKISGMTGTAQTSAEEFHKVYNLEVISIPTNRECVRRDHSDLIYKNFDAKMKAIAVDVKERHKKGQPVLIGTTSIAKNEILADWLRKESVPFELLNAKNNEREGAIIAQAGRRGAVTVATNMAGRGVDIILGGNPPTAEEGEEIKGLGGLYVIGTERHEARRIDNQLRGRGGRQGDPGESQFYLSLDDDLLRIFGGERIKNLMERFNLPDDQPIQMGFVSNSVAEAQAKVEGSNFDLRKHLLEYDDVLNKQRTAVYKKRQEILGSITHEFLSEIIFEAAKSHLEEVIKNLGFTDEEAEDSQTSFEDRIFGLLSEAGILKERSEMPGSPEFIENFEEILKKRSLEITQDQQTFMRLLSVLDMLWMNHLDELEELSDSVRLRAYAQRDPLVEYRGDANRLYRDFWRNFNGWVFSNLFKLATSDMRQATSGGESSDTQQGTQSSSRMSQNSILPTPPMSHVANEHVASVGRNEPCPCGSGKKYKKCHGK